MEVAIIMPLLKQYGLQDLVEHINSFKPYRKVNPKIQPGLCETIYYGPILFFYFDHGCEKLYDDEYKILKRTIIEFIKDKINLRKYGDSKSPIENETFVLTNKNKDYTIVIKVDQHQPLGNYMMVNIHIKLLF
jgi:hypothetical protein